jgi:alpha-beta hydrolase superfamily lysophospholipase
MMHNIQMENAIKYVHDNAKDLKIPIFLSHGTADSVVSFEGTRNFFEQTSVQDKTMKLYQGAKHNTFDDVSKEDFFRDVLQWLSSHI